MEGANANFAVTVRMCQSADLFVWLRNGIPDLYYCFPQDSQMPVSKK